MTWPASTHKGWQKKKSAGNVAIKKHIVKQHKKSSAGKYTPSSTGAAYIGSSLPVTTKGN